VLKTSLDVDRMRTHWLREDDLSKDFSPVFIIYSSSDVYVLLRKVVRRLSPIIIQCLRKREREKEGVEKTQNCVGVLKKKKKKNIIKFCEGLPHLEVYSIDPLSQN